MLRNIETCEIEAELGPKLALFATELRLLDLDEWAALSLSHDAANDIIESAAELTFPFGTIEPVGKPKVLVGWDREPNLSIDLVIRYSSRRLFGQISLAPNICSFKIHYVDNK